MATPGDPKTPEEIEKLQTAFVEKVSEDSLIQLIDALVLDGVLSEDEKLNIDRRHREAKAQNFIQTVRGKGPKAESKLKDHIKDKYPELAAKLHSDKKTDYGIITQTDFDNMQNKFEKVNDKCLKKIVVMLCEHRALTDKQKTTILAHKKKNDRMKALIDVFETTRPQVTGAGGSGPNGNFVSMNICNIL